MREGLRHVFHGTIAENILKFRPLVPMPKQAKTSFESPVQSCLKVRNMRSLIVCFLTSLCQIRGTSSRATQHLEISHDP